MNDIPDPGESRPPPKLDPETLVLRANPRPVTRMKRGVVIAAVATGATMVIGAAWVALQPPTLGLISTAEGRDPAPRAAPDALADAPRNYGEVPRLGRPLPGDLGRPILRREQETHAALADPEAETVARAVAAAEAERQRVDAEQRSARQSPVLVQVGGTRGGAPADALASLLGSPAPQLAGAFVPATNDVEAARREPAEGLSSRELRAPGSPYTLMAGSIIAASLITGLNSDLPGMVTAQVTENVYDSPTGRILLVPQGSRLIGSYDNRVAFGQRRALVVWQRLILPDGSSIGLEDMPASDTQGYAGLSDRVDRHTWQLLKGIALSTLLGVGTELQFGGSETDLVRAFREAAQESGSRAGDQIVGRSLDIQPTLRVRPGWPLRVVVHKDVVLRPWPARGA